MAVKKKEKSTLNRQSESSGSRKTNNSIFPISSSKFNHGGDADKAKTSKSKANNPQKMKSGEEIKEAKQVRNLPLMQPILEFGQFVGEVRAEARKISWPERSQVIRETVSVLFLVTLITLFVWLFDLTVARFVFAPLEHWGHLYGLGGNK